MKKVAVNPILILIFSILIVTITLTFGASTVWPAVRYGAASPCWTGFVSSVNTLSGPTIFRSPQKITLGDCAAGIAFINKGSGEIDEMGDKWSDLNCPKDKEAYIIGIPITGEKEWSWLPWKMPGYAWDRVKKFWKETLWGIGPICKSLDRAFQNPYKLDGPQSGTVTYCIMIKDSTDKKEYVVEKLALEECEK